MNTFSFLKCIQPVIRWTSVENSSAEFCRFVHANFLSITNWPFNYFCNFYAILRIQSSDSNSSIRLNSSIWRKYEEFTYGRTKEVKFGEVDLDPELQGQRYCILLEGEAFPRKTTDGDLTEKEKEIRSNGYRREEITAQIRSRHFPLAGFVRLRFRNIPGNSGACQGFRDARSRQRRMIDRSSSI